MNSAGMWRVLPATWRSSMRAEADLVRLVLTRWMATARSRSLFGEGDSLTPTLRASAASTTVASEPAAPQVSRCRRADAEGLPLLLARFFLMRSEGRRRRADAGELDVAVRVLFEVFGEGGDDGAAGVVDALAGGDLAARGQA